MLWVLQKGSSRASLMMVPKLSHATPAKRVHASYYTEQPLQLHTYCRHQILTATHSHPKLQEPFKAPRQCSCL